jgi:predicted ATP-grasp superfamily ATP-dependent carboligase
MERSGEHLCILGASARAAAFSAQRAGLRPWCADLFDDLDLRGHCPTRVVLPDRYPDEFVDLLSQAPPGPWMYTGALENRPRLIRQLARQRPLWGNDGRVLDIVRSPHRVREILTAAGLPCPVVLSQAPRSGEGSSWVVKPRASASGLGIRFWDGKPLAGRRVRSSYFQEFISGTDCAALFLGEGQGARHLGVTRQLVGEVWLGATPFRYCGSIGPLDIPATTRATLEAISQALTAASGLRGLFGVDFILRDGIPWPVEVNPRYTASVEVLEYATGLRALALHRQVFVSDAPPVPPARAADGVVGKAILFARAPLIVPEDGPWMASLASPVPVKEMPAFADIPAAGQFIEAGRPILTFFALAADEASCVAALRQTATDLDTFLSGR